MPTVHINTFVLRQTPKSPFSHYTFDNAELLRRVQVGFPQAKTGYREGVLLVPIDPEGVFSGVIQVEEGDALIGEYAARRPGEEPRTGIYALSGRKLPARSVQVVLYRHDVLAEGNEHESDCEYEIVSVNASPELDEPPIQPGTLMANYFGDDGGTDTHMTPEGFVQALRESRAYWKNRFLLASDDLRKKLNLPPRW